jgi:thioredoxin reductase (NADPH)
MIDVIVVGGGPAGMSVALNLLRAGRSVLILEKENFGGQIANSPRVENLPSIKEISGLDFAGNLFEQILDLGAKFELEEVQRVLKVDDVFEVTTNYHTYQAKAVVLANGVKHRKMGLPNEEEFIGKGISFCAVCDGAFYKDKVVAIYGGGYSTAYGALYLADIASKVYLIHHHEELRATGAVVDALSANPKIEMVLGSDIAELNGDDKITGITLADGRSLDVDALFVSIGRVPHCDFCVDLRLNDEGYIIADESCETNIPGIFVAGDVRTKALRQIVTATADGAAAAEAAIRFLN